MNDDPSSPKYTYTTFHKGDKQEHWHDGKTINDPYHWLEKLHSCETKRFIEIQNDFSKPFLTCDCRREIQESVTARLNWAKRTSPCRQGKMYYFFGNRSHQNQDIMYQQETLNSEPQVFFDPNKLSADGTVSLHTASFSPDGNYFAYGLSNSGTDWVTIKVRHVGSCTDFSDSLDEVKFSALSWTPDSKGFFYSRYKKPAISTAKNAVFTFYNGIHDTHRQTMGHQMRILTGYWQKEDHAPVETSGESTALLKNHKLYYHEVGNPQSHDIPVVEFPEKPFWRIRGGVSSCASYLLIIVTLGTNDNLFFFADLKLALQGVKHLTLHPVIDQFNGTYEYVMNFQRNFLFITNKNASNNRLVQINADYLDETEWQDLIPEDSVKVLEYAYFISKDILIVHRLLHSLSCLEMFSLPQKQFIREFPLDPGHIVGITFGVREMFFFFNSFVTPGRIYRMDLSDTSKHNVTPKVWLELKIDGLCPHDYQESIVSYSSKDGTNVRMHIVQKIAHLKEDVLQKKPRRPCLLCGYGGFGVRQSPYFCPLACSFIDHMEGIFALAMIRGGGEEGRQWHNAGKLLNKHASFVDFQCAAEFLINSGYTTRKRLAIVGASNGGLLVGACINERPELFRSAVAIAGVFDLIHYNRFTAGHGWIPEFGDPDIPEYFDNLMKLSPLHNIRRPCNNHQSYPATLVFTGDHDDRVSPLHSYKYAATLQEIVGGSEHQKHPLILKVVANAGHGKGNPREKNIEQLTDILVFLSKSVKRTKWCKDSKSFD